MDQGKTIFYVMGVSGCGKSSIGKLLAKRLQIPFYDGDDYHPKSNIEKMTAGNPLNDKDRIGWLEALNQLAKENLDSGAVIACSALKEVYRDMLSMDIEKSIRFVYLKGSYGEIWRRVQARKKHFMPSALLQSQFDTLEEPKGAITVLIGNSRKNIIDKIIEQYYSN